MGQKQIERGLSAPRLARALAMIEARLGERILVQDIADAAHLSEFHFTRMFRRSTGLSPHAYITRRRMDAAQRLLEDTDKSLMQVALAVGYRTQAHFTQVFRREVGVTPGTYRALQLRQRERAH